MTNAIRPLIAGNWKMNGLRASIAEFDAMLAGAVNLAGKADLLVCPPATLIAAFAETNRVPFDLPEADRHFLLSQRQSDFKAHKNISYRPKADVLRGAVCQRPEDARRLHEVMRNYSKQVTQFLEKFLTPYAGRWTIDP